MKKSKKRMFIVIIFLVILTIGLAVMMRGSYLEKLEIGEKYVSVFWKNVQYRTISIVATFIFIFTAIYITNKRIGSGLKEFFEDEKKSMPKLPNKSISLIISALVSLITSGITTKRLILFINSTSFQIEDPIFHHDIGYYLFQKPFLEYIIWFGIITIVALTIYAGIYYVVALNTQFDGVKSETLKNSKIVKQLLNNARTLSVLIAILTFLKTQDLSSSKFLTIGDKTSYQLYGAGLADLSIKLWGYRILSVIIVVSVFMAVSAYNKGKTKRVIGSILTVPIYLCLLVFTLLGYNGMFIKSNEFDKQRNYINYNIQNTRNSYNVQVEELLAQNSGSLEEEDIYANSSLINNVSIVNKEIVLQNLNGTLTNKGYYTFSSSSIGEYNIGGENKLVYVSPREIVNKGNSYVNSTYEYTHGYGVIATSASATNQAGNLINYQKDINSNDMYITEPRIYFGLNTNETIVTNSSKKQEFDYPLSEGQNKTNEYNGKAGLSLNFLDRFVLAISKGDTKLAFSSNVQSTSKILLNRNVLKRVKTIMPYITYDENPYLVVTSDGNLVWVIDGYTTSNYYPYAQKSTVNGKQINYIRNSVKVLVDAYDGTTKFYITDRTDPIVMAYRKAYNNLFEDLDAQIPTEVSEHFVYPQLLYDVQSNILKRYHNVSADVLYRTDDVWDISTYSLGGSTDVTPLKSYYTMIKTADSDKNKLGLMIPYTISGKQNITSYLVGTYVNGNPKLTLYNYPEDSSVLGLLQLDTQIQQNEQIKKQISNLNVSGTKLTKNIVVVPVNSKLLYVEAIYQQYINEEEALPTLKKVVVASGNKVAIGDDFKSAITNLVSQNAIGIEIENTDDLNDLIELVIKANKNLEQSTSNGDWEMVGKDVERLQKLINKLENVYEEEKGKKTDSSVNPNAAKIINELKNRNEQDNTTQTDDTVKEDNETKSEETL
ncbi:MAG: UPF0182 family protein [Clostridia bacterium]|nr:UPF0182 family protein [Clostridia bacterium]